MYLHTDPSAGHDILDSAEYYTSREDTRALIASPGIARQIGQRGLNRLIDLGPGDVSAFRNKIVPLVRIFSPSEYVAVDFSNHILAPVTAYCRSQFPDMAVRTIQCDFFRAPGRIPAADSSLIVILGNTFGDYPYYSRGSFPTRHFARFLRALKRGRDVNSALLISVDTNQFENSILHSYSGTATQLFFRKSLDWLALNAPRYSHIISHLIPQVAFDQLANCIVFSLYNTSEYVLPVPNTTNCIRPRSSFVIGVSYRFTEVQLSEICTLARLNICAQQIAPGGTTRLLLIA